MNGFWKILRLVTMAAAAVFLWALERTAPADVYTTTPGANATVADILLPQKLLREPISINGRAGELTVSTTKLTPAEAAAALKDGKNWMLRAAGPASLIVDETGGGKELRRHYVCKTGPGSRTLVFSLRLPAADGSGAVEWPKEIPPPAGTAGIAFRLERTGTTFAMFSSGAPPETAMRAYGETLRQAGWRRLAAKAGPASETNAEYVHEKSAKMVVLQAAPAPNGGCVVSVFSSAVPRR